MRLEDLINIKKLNIEEQIQEAIQDTRDELDGLTKETTCMIYSDYLSRNLTKRHVVNRVVSTKDYKYPYEHRFNIAPKDEDNMYLMDLTYSQFEDSEFPELLEEGYMIVDQDDYKAYLEVVGNVNIEKRKTK